MSPITDHRPAYVVHLDASTPDSDPLPMYTAEKWRVTHSHLQEHLLHRRAETGGVIRISGTVWEGAIKLTDQRGRLLAHHAWWANPQVSTGDDFAAGYLLGGDHRGEGSWAPDGGWLQCPRPHGRVQPDPGCTWCAGWAAAWE